jgi:hypothetical protein
MLRSESGRFERFDDEGSKWAAQHVVKRLIVFFHDPFNSSFFVFLPKLNRWLNLWWSSLNNALSISCFSVILTQVLPSRTLIIDRLMRCQSALAFLIILASRRWVSLSWIFFISEATDEFPSAARATARSLIHIARLPAALFFKILYRGQAFRKFSCISKVVKRYVSAISASLSFCWRYFVCTEPPDFFFNRFSYLPDK